jgi:hypothetical protein
MTDRRKREEVIRACRICLVPENSRQFNDFFDRRKDFAEKLFFLSNVKVFQKYLIKILCRKYFNDLLLYFIIFLMDICIKIYL